MTEFIEASDLFFFVASIGIAAMTLVIVVVGYQVAKMMEETRALIQVIQTEVGIFTSGRKELVYRAQFARTWLSSFIRILIKR